MTTVKKSNEKVAKEVEFFEAPTELFDDTIKVQPRYDNRTRTVETRDPVVLFEKMLTSFYNAKPYESIPSNNHELEVRFGNKGVRSLTRNDYDAVIKKLKSRNFFSQNENGFCGLRIRSEFLDPKSGRFKMSNTRVELTGYNDIQNYCKTNLITNQHSITFTKKSVAKNTTGEILQMVSNDNFNFRVSYQIEDSSNDVVGVNKYIIMNWKKGKKMFRYINRATFTHTDYPVNVDISLVKKHDERKTFNNIQESNVFNSPENCDIELEIDNTRIGPNTPFDTYEKVLKALKNVINIVLSGMQGTLYPCSYPEQNSTIRSYINLIHKSNGDAIKRIYPKHFIGPNPQTLQLKNVVPLNENSNDPNIRKQYTVTEKSDGSRCLLYISHDGKIYMINTIMNVIFTGTITRSKELFNSLLDGEIILHNKKGEFINLYAAFDLYFHNNKDVRSFSFMLGELEKNPEKCRYVLLKNLIKNLNPQLITKNNNSHDSLIRIECKTFRPDNPDTDNIFDACNSILKKERDNLFECNTDGLIFTPAYTGVGTSKIGVPSSNTKITWSHSFKWKPPQYNTIDFLVTTEKTTSGENRTIPLYADGNNTTSDTQIQLYSKIILRCSFIESQHGYINPCRDVIDDNLTEFLNQEETQSFVAKPVQFYPTNPPDANAGISNIMLRKDENLENQMFTEENQVFTDNTIVEFSYDTTKEEGWRWIPLRVRYDKTDELRQGLSNYGNAYHVADSNWHSIHYPITEQMISTGLNIPSIAIDDDVYYNSGFGESQTKSMRDFHNLYVKKILIKNVAKKGDTMIDYACGKGGDLPKWIASNLSFVFGIDISRDNLENRINGACARYLNFRKKHKHVPYVLFVNGNSMHNIKNGDALLNEQAVHITNAVFGVGENDEEKLGKGVSRQYGKARDGFNISSCQFAIHYFFENMTTLTGFLRNISECTKIGGYFIGTCYDGSEIFKLLRKKKRGDGDIITHNGKKIWEVIKDYDEDKFDDDASSVGYRINVFQETINNTISEYLVNFNYLQRIMENYGFVLIDRTEANELGFPDGSGSFSELYNCMVDEIKKNRHLTNDYGEAVKMTAFEEKISFLNKYFIYKKIRAVNAEKIEIEKDGSDVIDVTNSKKINIKKLNKKIPIILSISEVPVAEPTLKKVPVKEPKPKKVPVEKPVKEPKPKKVPVEKPVKEPKPPKEPKPKKIPVEKPPKEPKEPKPKNVTKKNVTGKPETKKTKKNVIIVEPEQENVPVEEPVVNEPTEEPKKATRKKSTEPRKTKKNSVVDAEQGEGVAKKTRTRKTKTVDEI